MNGLAKNRDMKSIRPSMKKNRDLILHSIMCSIGGFMGGYAVLFRGNLGSAQTINMIDIVLDIVGNNKTELLIRSIGFFLYILGMELVVLLSKKTKINLQRYSIFINMAGFLVLTIIPQQVNKVVGILPIFFMLSTQWSVFHGVRGYNSSTVFSTNNLRQMLLALNEYIISKDKKQRNTALYYINTLFWFHINIVVSYYAVKFFGIYASLFGFIYAVPALVITFIKDETVPVTSSFDYVKRKYYVKHSNV
ncbi:DUF1275 domain-containing protein [Lachnospiraceae bacterium MD1]|uniref:DUF1275 domain-containing protein n=1 Tax=Variimorphobacter saccharofermentans TaxID=2755051 RepID=A0A839K465_9FIRM|nr:YoaK family protein [Variimorphobacter saccharofermentans]MBB2183471.1 DUF1275 domain-containing protein [Variimorphobacter saccharofermentans]